MSTNFKGGLAVGGPAFDKSKLLRRPTPDSDALASSDDDRDHVPPPRTANPAYPTARRQSSGWLQDLNNPNGRKYSLPSASFAGSQPATPSLELPQQSRPTTAFPWNTSSFTSGSAGTRFKDVLPSPTSAHPPASPTTESDETIAFLLNQQTAVRKSARSQSYSVGQGEENSPAQMNPRLRSSLRHRPSKPSLLGESALGLTQLREDDIDEIESNSSDQGMHGVRLPNGYWERDGKNQQYLLKQAAEQNARRNRATSTGSPVTQQLPRKLTQGMRNYPSDFAIDENEDTSSNHSAHKMPLVRRYSEHISGLGDADLAGASMTPDWSVGNVPAMGADALSRRHSFAHYGSHTPTFQVPTLGNTQEEDEEEVSPLQPTEQAAVQDNFDHNAYFSGYGPASRAINASAISAAHPDPPTKIAASVVNSVYPSQAHLGRPGRRLYVVTFKCSRADIFYTYDNTGLEIRPGDLVICEGDRGVDLGQVIHADISLEDAKKHKVVALEDHLRWLVMFSQYSTAGSGNNPMLGALARAHGPIQGPSVNRAQLPGMGTPQDPDAKPKMIKRLAQQHEILSLRDKEGQEAKAKRLAVAKTADHGFPMEILDAEFQADHHKITFYYYAEQYVNFNPLVSDLFKHYKIRIWMSAVNPASVINPAGLMQMPPPSAIGPGAILHSNPQNASLSVGPGFGNNAYRPNEQRGGGGRGSRPHNGQQQQQGNFEEGFYAFSHQLPAYPSQQGYQMQWGQGQTPVGADVFGRFGFPNAANNGSPMNYGAWYPPTTYSASPAFNHASSGASFRGGYPAATSAAPGPGLPHGGASVSGMYPQFSGVQTPSFGTAGPSSYGQHGGNAGQPGQFSFQGHNTNGQNTNTGPANASGAANSGPANTSGDVAAAFANMSVGK